MIGFKGLELLTTYSNAILIYNPVAGRLRGRRRLRLDRALAVLAETGHRISAVPTTGPGTAGDIARRGIRDGADLVLVAGGDGTINETLNGMVTSEVPLGILPCGTANVLGNELGLDPRLEKTARELSTWEPKRISAGMLCTGGGTVSRHFLLMAGAGFDAHIVHSLNPELKERHGKLAYWITGFREVGRRLEEFNARVGERDFQCSFALASHVRNYGGTFEIARQASLFRDDFDIVLFEGANALIYAKYLAGVMTRGLDRMKGITTLRSERVELYGPADQRIYLQVDGEAAGRLPATIETVPNALTLLVPPRFAG